jgi:hypothetical protein
MEAIALVAIVWGVAGLLLFSIYRLYKKKKISWKQASVAVLIVFTLRGTLITFLAGVLIYDIYIAYAVPVTEYLASLFQEDVSDAVQETSSQGEQSEQLPSSTKETAEDREASAHESETSAQSESDEE